MRRFSALLVLLVVPLASCGGDEGGGDTAQQPSPAGPVGAGQIDAVRCAEIAAALASAGAAVPVAATGGGSELGQSVQTLESFADGAPEEIRADMQLIAEGYAAVALALQESGFDPASGQPPPPETIAALEEATALLSQSEFQEASARVNTWFAEECAA